MRNQILFILSGKDAILYRVLPEGGGLQYERGPYLQTNFHIGGCAHIGHTRDGGLITSTVVDIKTVEKNPKTGLSTISFQTMNNEYAIIVRTDDIEYDSSLIQLAGLTQTDSIHSRKWYDKLSMFNNQRIRSPDEELEAVSGPGSSSNIQES